MTTMQIDRAVVEQALEALEAGLDVNPILAGEAEEALRAALAQRDEPEAYGYASRLAVAIWEKHYKDTAPQWKLLDDLMGVLTQIDNMTSGLTRLAQQAEPVEPVATLTAQREDIIRMAREAGCIPRRHPEYDNDVQVFATPDVLERFLALAIAAKDAEHQQTLALQQRSYEREIQLEVEAEREACAKVCENIEEWQGEGSLELDPYYSDTYAAAIRARNNT